MTDLQRLYDELGMDALRKELASRNFSELLADLDDTVQMDLMKIDNAEWVATHKERVVFYAIRDALREKYTTKPGA